MPFKPIKVKMYIHNYEKTQTPTLKPYFQQLRRLEMGCAVEFSVLLTVLIRQSTLKLINHWTIIIIYQRYIKDRFRKNHPLATQCCFWQI